MKWFALLSAVVLVATATSPSQRSGLHNQLKWKPGTEYHFVYEGRMLTGIPQLATHYSGLGLKCKVQVTVSPDDYKLGLKVTDPQFVRVNQQLHGDGSGVNDNWRVIALPPYEQVPSEHADYLRMPVVFRFERNTGAFQEMHISADEPEWSVNFKKALISLLHVRFEQDSLAGGLENNMITPALERDSSSSEEESDDEYVDYWKTREQSLDGTCDVVYQISEIPKYLTREKPQKISYPQGCPDNAKYYSIVKTRDVASCSRRTSFVYYKPGFFRCQTGNCEGGMWTRSSITRFMACGKNRGDLRVQTIENEGELHQSLLGFKTEKFLTGTSQNLSLVEERKDSHSGKIDYPKNPIVMKELYYHYGVKPVNTDGIPAERELVDRPNLVDRQRHGRDNAAQMKGWQPYKLVPEIKKLFQQIVSEDLYNHVDIADKQVNMKALNLARAFAVLNKTAVREVYEELKGEFNSGEKKAIFKNVFFDTLMMGGSSSNIEFIKEKIESGELNKAQMISFFTFLPQYVLTPTRSLLKDLFQLVTESHKVRETPFIYNHAIMSFSMLVQKACIADNREVSYPTYVYGPFCNQDDDIVVNRWIPYLTNELKSAQSNVERRNLIIVTLGLLGHKNVLPALVPYVEGRFSNHGSKDEGTKMTRFLAVYALSQVSRKYPALVTPMLFSVFENQAERTAIRIAAFNVLLRSEPSMTVFHKIAASTWRERDLQVLQVVNTALFSLSQEKAFESMEITGSTLPRKAYLVYPLIKKTFGDFPTSASVHSAEYLKTLGIGYRSVTNWIDSKNDVFPEYFFTRIMYFFDRYQFTPIEFGIKTGGMTNLIEQIIEILDPESRKEYMGRSGEIVDEIAERVEAEWRNIARKLRLDERKGSGSSAEASVYLNLFEDSPMFFNFHSKSAQALREKINKMVDINEIRDIMSGQEKNINFQSVFDLTPSELSIPSDMGLPIIVEVHMPVTFSIRGKLSADILRSNPKIQMNFQTLFASQVTGWVGTVCPFTDEFTFTGVEKHTVLNLPAEFTAEFDWQQSMTTIRMKALESTIGRNGDIDILTFEVRPFTVKQKIYDLTPMTLSSEFRMIHSSSPVQTKSYNVGEYLGLSMKSVISSESYFLDFRTFVQKMRMYSYSPLNLIRFGWTNGGLTEDGHPSLRRHKIQFRYNPSQSSTKEIEFKIHTGYGYKNNENLAFHAFELNNNANVNGFPTLKNIEKALNANNERHQRISAMLNELDIDSGHAFTIKFSTILKGGSRPRTISYAINFAHGLKQLTEKWNVHLESDNGNKDLCLEGFLSWPKSIPVWKMDENREANFEFGFENVIGFGGNSCKEHRVRITGKSRVSDKQKDQARLDTFSKRTEQRDDPFLDRDEVNEIFSRQRGLLDEVDFEVKYENVPAKYMAVPETFVRYLSSIWWPYINDRNTHWTNEQYNNQRNEDSVSGNTKATVRFHPLTGTFNLTMERYNGQKIHFEFVPTPYPLSYFFPVSATKTSLGGKVNAFFNNALAAATGFQAEQKCKVEGNWIKRYDNQTADLKLDDCYHLLTADCSSLSQAKRRFAVLVKESSSSSEEKEVKVFIGKTEIKLISKGDRSEIKVIVNGSEIDQSIGQTHKIRDSKARIVAEISLSSDRVTVLKSHYFTLAMNKRKIVVEVEAMYLKGKLCGLCGQIKSRRNIEAEPLSGPTGCPLSKPELFAASYRIDNDNCQPLNAQIARSLEKENRQCANKVAEAAEEEYSTKLSKPHDGHCPLLHRHVLIDQGREWCFSRLPVTHCSKSCSGKQEVLKSVSIGCLEKNRQSNWYADRARRGETIHELTKLEEKYVTKMKQPSSCSPLWGNSAEDY